MEQAMTESPRWLFMESSWKTKSIRLGTPSHRYWLAVSDYEAGGAGWCSKREWEQGMVRDLKSESEWERRKQGEGGCFDASAIHWHQWDAGAWGGRALLLSVMIVGEAERRQAATNRSNVQNVWKHCNLKIMWQQCTAPLFLCVML